MHSTNLRLETVIGSQFEYALVILRRFKAIFLGFFLVVTFFAFRFFSNQFCLDHIRFDHDYPSSIVLNEETREEIGKILAQRFTYLDRGRQSFVFLSSDEKYVLKFFDAHRLRPSFFSHSGKKLRKKYNLLFEGYETAYLQDREHTGLIFAKLGNDSSFHTKVQLVDRFGFKREVPLQSVPFVLQKKATPMRVLVSQLLDSGDVEGAKVCFRKIAHMYVDEYRKGLRDVDRNFMYNTGFIGDQPIRIDVGRLGFNDRFKSPILRARDLHKILILRASSWLHRHYPQYEKVILKDIRELLVDYH